MSSLQSNQHNPLRIFSPGRILLAVAIGLSITTILFYHNLDGRPFIDLLSEIANPNWLWLILCLFVLFIRDAGYMYRIKRLTGNELSWKGSIYVIILWEFASAVTPSVVGGTALAAFLLNKEGISMGKSIAYVMLTAILDNAFFIIAAPIVLLTAHQDFLFTDLTLFSWHLSLKTIFLISYGLIATYTSLMVFGILFSPKSFQSIIISLSTFLRFKQKWKRRLYRLSFDVISASCELRGKPTNYWITAISSTICVWSARYFLLNCLLAAYSDMSFMMHIDAFQKQIILWITQLISPTPGAAGIAEYFLQEIFGKGLLILSIAVLWRTLTYYGYLVAGSIALPRWIKRVLQN